MMSHNMQSVKIHADPYHNSLVKSRVQAVMKPTSTPTPTPTPAAAVPKDLNACVQKEQISAATMHVTHIASTTKDSDITDRKTNSNIVSIPSPVAYEISAAKFPPTETRPGFVSVSESEPEPEPESEPTIIEAVVPTTSSPEHSATTTGTGVTMTAEAKALFVFAADKAGMSSVDREHTNRVIYEMSKNSKYMIAAEKKNANVSRRINMMRKKLASIQSSRVLSKTITHQLVAKQLANAELERDFTRTIIHVDMDMFFVAVELRDQPELRGKPVAVGGIGMITTSNYEARQYGVRSAMPGFIAKKLCPDLIFVKSNFAKYRKASEQVRHVFRHFDPTFEPASLDEAYLDVTDYIHRIYGNNRTGTGSGSGSGDDDGDDDGGGGDGDDDGSCCSDSELNQDDNVCCPECPHVNEKNGMVQCQSSVTDSSYVCHGASVARDIRQRIFAATQLTASCGVGPNRMIAKICSDKNKPNGQYVVANNRQSVLSFMRDLKVRCIPGVGRVMERILGELGIHKCADLYEHHDHVHLITRLFSAKTSAWLLRRVLGIAPAKHSFMPAGFGHDLDSHDNHASSSSSSDKAVVTPGGEVISAMSDTTVSATMAAAIQEKVSRAAKLRRSSRKSVSRERTFRATADYAQLVEKLKHVAEKVSADMKKLRFSGRTVTIKVKGSDFEVWSHAKTLDRPIASYDHIIKHAVELLKAYPHAKKSVRLLGIRLSKLHDCTVVSPLDRYATRSPADVRTPAAVRSPAAVPVATKTSSLSAARIESFFGATVDKSTTAGSTCPAPAHAPPLTMASFRRHREERKHHKTATSTATATSSTTVTVTARQFKCPVCNQHMESSLFAFNTHVDQCLNAKSKRKADITAFFARKRRCVDSES
jgi:nucleotidyltransferase/DNA polymerase involved in DNA repair